MAVFEAGGAIGRTVLLSLDIDGTLETGDPPGPLTLDFVQRMRGLGYVVGSASDRTLGEQRDMWGKAGLEVDFVSHKHQLERVRSQFECLRFIHIGDTMADQHYAKLAGFEFHFVSEFTDDDLLEEVQPEGPSDLDEPGLV